MWNRLPFSGKKSGLRSEAHLTLGYLEAEKSEEGAGGDYALEQAAQGRVDGEGGVHAHQAWHDASTCLQTNTWLQPGLRFRIRIQGGEIDTLKKKKLRNLMFGSAGCSLLWAVVFFYNLDVLYGGLGIGKL